MSEEELIQACLRGNPQAQRALYERYKVSLFRLCLRYAGDRAEAEDFLQESFIRIFNDLKNYRGEGAFGGWMRRVTLNAALQQLRKKSRRPDEMQFEPALHILEETANLFDEMDAEALTGMIQRLPPGYRAVFNLYVIEGFSHREIADMLGISESASKTQLFKAKAALRKMAQKYYPQFAKEGK